MLFASGQVLAGSISGGCLEAGIVRKGPWLARERPACIRFDGSREDEDDESPRGTGCDGVVDILLERASFDAPCAALAVIEDCLRGERARGLGHGVCLERSTRPRRSAPDVGRSRKFSTGALSGPSWAALAQAAERALAEQSAGPRMVSSDGVEALLEVIEPPPHLFVIGAGPDALPLVDFAAALGFGVTVCDTSARVAVRERFAARAELHVGSVASIAAKLAIRRTAVAVVMSHHYPTDAQALGMLLDSRAAYIGHARTGAPHRAHVAGAIPGPSGARRARSRARTRADRTRLRRRNPRANRAFGHGRDPGRAGRSERAAAL